MNTRSATPVACAGSRKGSDVPVATGFASGNGGRPVAAQVI